MGLKKSSLNLKTSMSRVKDSARQLHRSTVSIRQVVAMWLGLICLAFFLTGVVAVFDPAHWSWSVWVLMASVLVGWLIVLSVRNHYLMRRVDDLERRLTMTAKQGARLKPRARWRRSDVERFFGKNQTLH